MKLFITGISGLLGLNLALQARERFQISGCYYAHPIVLDGIQALKADIASTDVLDRALRKIRPDVILHTAGLTNVEECEANPVLAQRLNVEAVQHVAKIADTLRARLIHISTDHLYDGAEPWKKETDIPDPLNVYARTKWEAEQVVLKVCPDAMIIRTNFFGWGTSIRVSFSDWILNALAENRELTMFNDVFFTPILINDLVDKMIDLMVRKATGIFHVAGGERLSKYAFAIELAQVFNYSKDKIRQISVEGFPFRAKRPKDMSLSSEKAGRYLGMRMPAVKDALNRLKEIESEGHSAALERAVQEGYLI